ncbi:MAG: phosphate acyltransferase [Verrucomicrobiae bacterium]|nr:phosphate acyltransferase [Verrucomicrobiae bacterium]
MRLIAKLIEKLQRHPKRIVFPEGTDPRILQAARQFHALRLGAPIVLGDKHKVRETAAQCAVPLDGIRVIDPEASADLDSFVQRFMRLKKSTGVQEPEARLAMKQPNYFGAMMVAMHQADGFVSGASDVPSGVFRALFQIIRVAPQATAASGCTIVEVEDSRIGENGVLFMADCGVIPEPSVEELAEIAVSTASLARHLLNIRPRVAFLSFSTKGSVSHPSTGRVQAAAALARQLAGRKALVADFDGELQLDTALVEEIARRKAPDSPVAGRANVLIFPELNSGNIAAKLLQHVARANVYGQILLGLDRPAAEISRGSTPQDILGVATIVGVQAIAYHLLYPGSGEVLPGE